MHEFERVVRYPMKNISTFYHLDSTANPDSARPKSYRHLQYSRKPDSHAANLTAIFDGTKKKWEDTMNQSSNLVELAHKSEAEIREPLAKGSANLF